MDMDNGNAFANYKGVMMCTRPQDKASIVNERPFCSMVTPGTELGVNPDKPGERQHKKRVLPAILNHKKFLDGLKDQIEDSKIYEQERQLNEEIRKLQIREKAEETRKLIREGGPFPEVIKKSKVDKRTRPISPKTNFLLKQNEENNNGYNHSEPNYPQIDIQIARGEEREQNTQKVQSNNEREKPTKETKQKVKFDLPEEQISTQQNQQDYNKIMESTELKNNVDTEITQKKKSKPAWAVPTQQQENFEEAEEEELINFMGNLNFDEYVDDVEVRTLIQSLKSRVDSLKEEPDWRDKWKKRLKEKTEKRKQDYLDEKQRLRQDDDNCSVVASQGGDSKASFLFGGDALTVSSSKTQENIEELKNKLKKKKDGKGDWEKSVSATSKQSDLENRIAKHIADEILRTNMAMSKIHSNQSIRKIMEQELQSQLRNKQRKMQGDGLDALNEEEMDQLYL